MFHVIGDIHGNLEIGKVIRYFERQSKIRTLTKDDYLILLGDCGVCWNDGRRDEELKRTLQSLPVTTLFVDGNHENFDILNSYPVTTWCGGKVHMIEEDIIHLMRGQVFTIDGKKFFTMGGAASQDKMFRTERVTWFPEELPSIKEFEEGEYNLIQHNHQIDFILSHNAPWGISYQLGNDILEEEEPFLLYLQDIADNVEFKYWFFGHYHLDVKIDKFRCLYDKFIRIKGKKD